MTTVTREMIAAAHDVTMRHKIVLGHELLTEIYQAMNTKKGFVGLTDEEYSQLHDGFHQQGKLLGWVVDQVETKLREKNAQPSKPLTDEQIDSMYLAMLNDKREFDGPRDSLIAIVRAVESAHGIKKNA